MKTATLKPGMRYVERLPFPEPVSRRGRHYKPSASGLLATSGFLARARSYASSERCRSRLACATRNARSGVKAPAGLRSGEGDIEAIGRHSACRPELDTSRPDLSAMARSRAEPTQLVARPVTSIPASLSSLSRVSPDRKRPAMSSFCGSTATLPYVSNGTMRLGSSGPAPP
jgi:hypothetical protein